LQKKNQDMRQKIAAGNWKMNKTYNDAMELAQLITEAPRSEDVLTILAVPSLYLAPLQELTHSGAHVDLAAQNCHHEASGAYTGEISVSMIESIGIQYCIVGHSERREYNGETEEMLLKKMLLLHESHMKPIYCCGEPLAIRKAGTHKEYVLAQLQGSLLKLTEEQIKRTIVAYEPIWAIGTGETASSEQAQEMHAAIRASIASVYGQEVADGISILYGGSVKSSNAAELFGQADVDGGLVGGASLQADEFVKIINAF
jgi:triosephosphate isomerase (TIM)